MTSPLVAVAALALGAALVLGAAAGPAVLAAAVLLAQGLVIVDWHRTLGVAGARGGIVVGAVAAVGSDALVLADVGERPLAAVPGVLAAAVVGALVHQLARRDGRDRLTASLTATVSLAALVALGSTLLAVHDEKDGLALISTAAAAAALVAAGVTARQLAGAPRRADVAVVAGAAVLVTVSVVALDGLAVTPAFAVAGTAGTVAWVAGVLVARSAEPHVGPGAALPLVLAGPVAYVLGRLLVG